MLIVNDGHLRLTEVCSLDELCPFCGLALVDYPLIMCDDTRQAVYHVACAIQLACDIMTDTFTFFHPPHPYTRLFTLMEHLVAPNHEGGSHAIHEP